MQASRLIRARSRTALEDAPHFEALILDGKPNASTQTVEIATAADLVVIPTGQTLDDLHPGVLLAHSLKGKGIAAGQIVFVLLRTTGSRRENEAARQYLADAGYTALAGEVPMSTAYGMAADAGKAITETSYNTLNTRAATVAQGVIDTIMAIQNRRAA